MASDEPEQVHALLQALLAAIAVPFPPVKNDPLPVPTVHGVYVIEDADGTPLHVGRTKTGQGGLQQRLYDHMYGTSSFACEYVRPSGKVVCGSYRFKFLAVPDPRLRGLLESYAIGHLCPAYFGVG